MPIAMAWQHQVLEQLAAALPWGYAAGAPGASEPTALAGLALVAGDDNAGARAAADWLAQIQSPDGSVGVTASQKVPCWPTSLATILWQRIATEDYADNIQRALTWTLDMRGRTGPRKPQIGHDTTLTGWSWAADTHSWLEPTALFVLALKASGMNHHERTREAVRLLVDRLLPEGGCNYGNTQVLGQTLIPHIQPTGIVMMPLASEKTTDSRIEKSLAYLERELSDQTPTASLAYGVLGLAAHQRRPATADDWLAGAYHRQHDASPYKLALLAMAAAPSNPLLSPV